MNDQEKIARLWGAIEDYLDGESHGNVTGLRQAMEACGASDDLRMLARQFLLSQERIAQLESQVSDLKNSLKEYDRAMLGSSSGKG